MLDSLVIWIVETVGAMGYPGIIALMFLESSFFPFPSEVVIVPAGYLASRGGMNIFLVVASGIGGSVLGALFNYYVAFRLGRPMLLKYGRYVWINDRTLKRAEDFFNEHGEISIFIGRLVIAVRQYISLPAGLCRMRLDRFMIYTSLGAGVWVIILAVIGYMLGSNEELVRAYVKKSTLYLLGFCAVLAYVYIRHHKRKSAISYK
jgi:membrane protein DedA with SNARE-associated domain